MQQLLARGRGAALRPVPSQCLPALPCTPSTLRTHRQRYMSLQATPQEEVTTTEASSSTSTSSDVNLDKELTKLTRSAAATFAPRASTATKNPAFRGSTLYNIFEVQAWISVVVGGLLSFNLLYPTDGPDIPRLLGMWSIWMFTIPSLRARECTPKEKDALNILFIAVPLMNVALPFVWKSFPFIFTADVVALAGIYYSKGVWREVYGLPFGAEQTDSAASN